MNPETQGNHDTDSQSMRPIEREILLASSGELSLARRCVLWVKLRFDRDACAYAAAERLLRDAAGSSERSRRPIWRGALVPLAAAAALALAMGLWNFRTTPPPSSEPNPGIAVGEMLETPLISRTRQLAIEAERSAGAPHVVSLANAESHRPLGAIASTTPTWTSQWSGVLGKGSWEK